jgi:hypothetical protein
VCVGCAGRWEEGIAVCYNVSLRFPLPFALLLEHDGVGACWVLETSWLWYDFQLPAAFLAWRCRRCQLAGRKAASNHERTRVCYRIRKRVNDKEGGDAPSGVEGKRTTNCSSDSSKSSLLTPTPPGCSAGDRGFLTTISDDG